MWINVLEITLATAIRTILNALFIFCFLPFKPKFSKKKIFRCLFLMSTFWTFFEFLRIIIENTFMTFTYDEYFTVINSIRSIAMMYSVTYLFRGKYSVKVLLTILWISLAAFWEGVQQILYYHFFSFENYVSFILNGFAWTGASSLELVSIFLIRKFRNKGIHLPNKTVLIQTFLVLFSFLNFGIGLVSLTLSKSNDSLSLNCLILNLLTAVLIVIFYFIFELMNKVQYNKQIYELEAQRYHLLERYYRDIELHQNDVRKMKHDMNNQLLSIKGQLLQKNTVAAKSQIQEFLNRLE